MIKTKELEGPSCLTNAADDEPLFVLRANDELAPEIVTQWASEYLIAKGFPNLTGKQWSKYEEALDIADQMRRWKNEHP